MSIIKRRLQGCLDKLVTCDEKLYVYIFVTKMAYSLSLVPNYMDNSFLVKRNSNFLVFSSTGSSILSHISNTWKISVGKHYNYYEWYSARFGVVTGQPCWGFTDLTSDPNWIMVVLAYLCVVNPEFNIWESSDEQFMVIKDSYHHCRLLRVKSLFPIFYISVTTCLGTRTWFFAGYPAIL